MTFTVRGLLTGLTIVCCLSPIPASAETNGDHAAFLGDVPKYQEEALQAGINHAYAGPWEYFVGGGLATFDCNADRLPDVFIAGGVNESALYVNQSSTGGALKFERQNSPVTNITRVTGAYPINLDNDQWTDLVVLRVG